MSGHLLNKSRSFWICTVMLVLIVVIFHCSYSEFDHDEIEHLHAAWMMSQGLLPFTDFLEQHHPTLWYLLAPFTHLFERPETLVFFTRLALVPVLTALLYFFVLIVKEIYPETDWKWPALLLVSSFTFTKNQIEVRPDPIMNLCIFAALYFLVRFLRNLRYREAFISGVLMGIAIAILQKAIVVFMLSCSALIILIFLSMNVSGRPKAILIGIPSFVVGAALPLTAFFTFMASSLNFEDFFFWNYTFNRHFYTIADLGSHFSFFKTFTRSLEHNALVWILGTLGLVIIAGKVWRSKLTPDCTLQKKIFLSTIAIGYLGFLLKNRFPLSQYFIVLMPLIAVMSCEVFERFNKKNVLQAIKVMVLLMLVELIALMTLHKQNTGNTFIQTEILSNTMGADRIFASPPHHPIFRFDSSYFWYNGTLIGNVASRLSDAQAKRAISLDERMWNANPPVYVFFEEHQKDYYPYRWNERSKDYAPVTGQRGLFKRIGK